MDLKVALYLQGAARYEKVSYPIRYGRYSEITDGRYRFQFNLNQEIKHLQGTGKDWPHPSEWLKRTAGNHWVYYDSGGYHQVFDYLGEYYLPYFTYPSNHLWEADPFAHPLVKQAFSAFRRLPRRLAEALKAPGWSEEERSFLEGVIDKSETVLAERAERLRNLLGGEVTVLPPDSRHVDYDVLPLHISDGCLYHCTFCRVKTHRPFSPRSRQNILEQLRGLREFFGPDLANYNSLFLGQHDALQCGSELILTSAALGYQMLELDRSCMEGSNLFLFGSVDSFLQAEEALFERLNRLPYRTFLNLGLESADQETLDRLGKPIRAERVLEAFSRLIEINRRYDRVEVTANWVIDPGLPHGHWETLGRLCRDFFPRYFDKGALYLSPLRRGGRRELLQRFQALKMKSRIPLYLYLIQRL